MTKKTSEAQIRASRKWEKKNPERTKYIRYRGQARTFLRHWAKEEDLKELEEMIEERRRILEENE